MSSINVSNGLTNGHNHENGYEQSFNLKNGGHFATRAIHAGQDPSQWTSRAVVPPISMSTTFEQHSPANTAVSPIKP